MPASRPSPEGGRRLKAERARLQLSPREVERLSQEIADEKKNREYYISHAWLTDLENGDFVPGIFKLYSLSVILKRRYDEILEFFDIPLSQLTQEQKRFGLPNTFLIGTAAESQLQSAQIAATLKKGTDLGKTNLVSHMFEQWGAMPISLFGSKHLKTSIFGYIGTEDFTLSPLIRPGSFVEIDSHQTKVERGEWHHEYDRPIYFIELRDSYVCSWCEPKEGKLLLIPYPRSRTQVREVRYPGDSRIIGRVTAVSMRIAEEPVNR